MEDPPLSSVCLRRLDRLRESLPRAVEGADHSAADLSDPSFELPCRAIGLARGACLPVVVQQLVLQGSRKWPKSGATDEANE